ncbi:DUF1707 and DUF4190 domain-containing protein [Streptomyces avermitilis]|uniref:DUF1707 and DUF4190 domain-containing protein n=1 Tax=Streptomyces avermitilis TaxID=33903 RepID=UPI0033E48B1F
MSYPTPWQPWQGQNGPQPWQGQSAPAMLAAHADRERAVDVLRAGFGEGRLEQDEFEKRVARAYAARTVGELAVLVGDLPQGPVPLSAASGPAPRTFLPAPPPATNGKAVAAMVCGVLTLMTAGVTGVPAVILGHTARSEIRRTGEGGEGFAMAGLVLGWLSVAGWALLLTVLIAAALVSG